MASLGRPANNTTAISSDTASNTSETIVGAHVFRIDGFSATKDLGVGECMKTSTFCVGGHGWYVECYPCGVHEGSAGWVSLFLCRQEDRPGSRLSAKCNFTLMVLNDDGCFEKIVEHHRKSVTFEHDNRHSLPGTDFIKRNKLESLLKNDCFKVRCVVFIEKFPDVPLPQPYLASGTVAASHSHVLTVDGYSKTRRAHAIGESIDSKFRFAGHSWCLGFYPVGQKNYRTCVSAYLMLDQARACNDEVKIRIEMILLTHAGQIISSIQDFNTFSDRLPTYAYEFLCKMEHESSPILRDGFKIRCDMAVVEGITAMPNPGRCTSADIQESQQVSESGDVTFDVGGHLFAAHKCVLTTRCMAFMAEFFGHAGKESADVTGQHVRIDGMEPRVFEALLHFIYTNTLPEVREEDKIGLATGLLVAADRYAIERLKVISGDLLCNCIDATTAVTTLELAEKHGCVKLKEACIKVIREWLAKVTP